MNFLLTNPILSCILILACESTQPNMHEWLSGGVSPCQGEGRGFESRLVLFSRSQYDFCFFAFREFFHIPVKTTYAASVLCSDDLSHFPAKTTYETTSSDCIIFCCHRPGLCLNTPKQFVILFVSGTSVHNVSVHKKSAFFKC